MEFKKNQTIYKQIADFIYENIMTLKWPVDQKISSVRELAGLLQVNPNTVMRTYSMLQDQGIIYNKRGIGYFVSAGAPDNIETMKRNHFVNVELPEVFKKMNLLKIDIEEVNTIYHNQSK